ncbi:hypothetical protein [Bradyrhizobium sp. B120]|uniref:hypothetical protein n=1 Tax=Bradyrhizobium sp. B120 TaxID=3410088 RepID=UPI003B987C1A
MVQLKRLMAEREIPQTEAANLVEMKQPDPVQAASRAFQAGFGGKAAAHAHGVRPGR